MAYTRTNWVNDSTPLNAEHLNNIEDGIEEAFKQLLVIDIPAFSSLPQTISNANITENHVLVNSVVGTPKAQISDWVVTTAEGQLSVTGDISGSTGLTLYLMTQIEN